MATWRAVVLAAGAGTRMRSRTPKVLHPICGKPIICHVVGAVRETGLPRPVVVVGPDAVAVRETLGADADYAVQETPGGTAHALGCAQPLLEGAADHVLVLCGDAPLLETTTLGRLMEHHLASNADVTFITTTDSPQGGLGRVVRDIQGGGVSAIVEEHEASPSERAIREVNGGVYCLRSRDLWPRLASVPSSPRGERYLTDLVAIALQDGGRVESVRVDDGREVLGVNSRVELARAEAVMRERIRCRLMLAGVTIIDPPSTFIDSGVEVGQDTVVYPNTHLYGRTRIGSDCRIGPGAVIQNTEVGAGCHVASSTLEGSVVGDGVEVGPYAHLRPESVIERDVHIGNYVEVKKSRLGEGVKVGHFSYIGDAEIGARANIGAGTVTCNFDGASKNPTTVEEDAFIGCDTMLVAPVRVGRGAVTGAGAVVTRDVAPGGLVVGVPARPLGGDSGGKPPGT